MKKKVIIVGMGKVGKGLFRVLEEDGEHDVYTFDVKDEEQDLPEHFDFMHICFPVSDKLDFVKEVSDYSKRFNVDKIIVNSTVPVGTSRKIFEMSKKSIAHIPIRGIHPNLSGGIRHIPAMIGCLGGDKEDFIDYYHRMNIDVHVMDSPEVTELGKILSTTTYGVYIEWHRQMFEACKKYELPFTQVVSEFTGTYNAGYQDLDHYIFTRPLLYPPNGPLGGHCILENASILKKDIEKKNSIYMPFLKHLVEYNNLLKKRKNDGKKEKT